MRDKILDETSGSLNPNSLTGWMRSSCFIRSANPSCCELLIWSGQSARAHQSQGSAYRPATKREGISDRQRGTIRNTAPDRCVALSNVFLKIRSRKNCSAGNVKPGDRVDVVAADGKLSSRFRNHRHKAAHRRRRRRAKPHFSITPAGCASAYAFFRRSTVTCV